jgi:hypothetical protein
MILGHRVAGRSTGIGAGLRGTVRHASPRRRFSGWHPTTMPHHRPVRLLLGLALVLALAGGTFALQGIGVPIGRSFMIGDLRWAAIGLALLAIAAAIAWWSRGP